MKRVEKSWLAVMDLNWIELTWIYMTSIRKNWEDLKRFEKWKSWKELTRSHGSECNSVLSTSKGGKGSDVVYCLPSHFNDRSRRQTLYKGEQDCRKRHQIFSIDKELGFAFH